MTNPSNLGVAEIRRSMEVERITKSIAIIERDIGQGVNDANGIPSSYKAERREWLIGERDRLREVITELGNLSPEDLVEKVHREPPVAMRCPAVAAGFPGQVNHITLVAEN